MTLTLHDGLRISLQVMGAVADAMSIALGAVAFWGIVFKRAELRRLLAILSSLHLNQRMVKIRDTLGSIDALDYNDKVNRSELRALIGQLCGQLKAAADETPKLVMSYQRVADLASGKEKLTESRKRQMVHELHGALDFVVYSAQTNIMESKE